MSSLDDGYTRIANELLEAIISFGLKERELKIVLFIIRKTYGFGKKTDDISTSQIANFTNIHPNHVRTAMKKLAKSKVIYLEIGKYGHEVGVNKSIDEWEKQPNQLQKATKSVATKSVVSTTESVAEGNQIGCLGQPNQLPTKENQTKETKQKKNNSLSSVREAFPMSFDWQPSSTVPTRLQMMGVDPGKLTPEVLGGFKNQYTHEGGIWLSQTQWESKLCTWVKNERTGGMKNASTRTGKRNNATSALDELGI